MSDLKKHKWRMPTGCEGEPIEEGEVCDICGAYLNQPHEANQSCPAKLGERHD